MYRVPAAVIAALAVGTVMVPAATAASPSAVSSRATTVPVTASDPGQITVRLLDASVARRNDPRARIYIDDHVSPGTTVIRHVDVSSSAKRPVALQFYADAASVEAGAFLPASGRGRNDLTTWTTVTPSAVTLPANGHIVLTVQIAVPRDVQPGERYGVVLAEVPAGSAKAGTVATGARVGIRVYLSVGRGSEPVTDFTVSTLTASRTKQGQPEVKAQVQNTGGRAVDLTGTLTLDHGPGGLRAGPYAVALGTTLGVGQTAPVSILLDPKLPDGPWHAVLTMHSGPVTRAVEGIINFPSAAGTSSPAVTAKAIPLVKRKDVVVPVAAALIGGLAFAFLLFLLLWRRRKKKEDEEQNGPGADGPGLPPLTGVPPQRSRANGRSPREKTTIRS